MVCILYSDSWKPVETDGRESVVVRRGLVAATMWNTSYTCGMSGPKARRYSTRKLVPVVGHSGFGGIHGRDENGGNYRSIVINARARSAVRDGHGGRSYVFRAQP